MSQIFKSAKYVLWLTVLSFSLTAVPSPSMGGGTRIWELAGFEELSKGELDGTNISSAGEVRLGYRAHRLDLENVGLVWSVLEGNNGRFFLGTGYDGKIYRVEQNKVTHLADTGQVVVTSMVLDKKGDLFVSTLPDAVIWQIKNADKNGDGKPKKAQKWAELPKGTEHVWALAFSRDERTLFAATGPEGKLFAIGRDKKPRVYFDIEEEHLLSIAVRRNGNVLVGTSPGAMLFELSGPGRSTAIADFDATEVKAIREGKSFVFAAVNTFKKPPAVPTKSKNANNSDAEKGTGGSKKNNNGSAGDGNIFRIGPRGRIEQLWEEKKAHVVSLAVGRDDKVYAGLGTRGTVLSIDEARSVTTELDLDERQVMGLIARDDLTFVAMGDAGAAYTVNRSAARDSVYFTPPMDAANTATWGRVTWFTRGAIAVASRSGNTEVPDASWSDWSKPIKRGSVVSSPSARYLQFRFTWAPDAKAELLSLELAYRNQNRRALIEEFDPGSPFPKPRGADDGEPRTSDRTIEARPDALNDAALGLTWSVDNPDGDALRYRLWYRALGERVWRPITREDEIYRSKRYNWDTQTVPEGWYQIRLQADDSPANDARDVMSDEYISVPVLIDNHQPVVKGLKFEGGAIRGVAEDSCSPISGLEYAVDAGPWMPVFCEDEIFDETKETFKFSLPKELESGPHAVAVRAVDRAGNRGVAEIHIDVATPPKKRK